MVRSRALRLAFVTAAALCALAPAPATADVDVEVPLALNAKGTILPAGEVETFRFRATQGTRLTFQAAAAKGRRLRFTARLFGAGDTEVVIPAKLRVSTKNRLSVRNLRLDATADYRLVISATGTGTGNYTLTLKGKPGTSFGATLLVPQASTVPFGFSAPPGSRVTLTARRAAGSKATPRFHALSGDGFDIDLGSAGTRTLGAHSVVIASIGGTGDFSVDLDSPGGAGKVVVTATVKPKSVKTLKLDTSGGRRGHPHGGEAVIVRSVPATGGVVEITDPSSDLLGAKVTIPPGAMAATTTITLASAPQPTPPDPDDQAAGPALFLGPSGVTFTQPVQVVLPFDPAQIPVGQTAQDLRVLVVEEGGSTSILLPTFVDEPGRGITVEANGFSTCVAIAVRGQQPLGVRPGGDDFWLLTVDAELDPDGSQDSRRRKFGISTGEASFQSAGVFQASTESRSVEFDNPTAASGDFLEGSSAASSAPSDSSTTWSYGADGQTILLADEDGGAPATLVTSRDGNYIVARGNTAGEPRAELDLLIRKNTTPLTASSLAGKYHLVLWGLDAEQGDSDVGVRWQAHRAVGTWTFHASGKFDVTYSQRESRVSAAGTATSRFESGSASGTFSVEPAGTVVATFPPRPPDDSGSVLRFRPGPGAAVMLGADRDFTGDEEVQVFVLVREGTGLGNGTVTGDYRGMQLSTSANPYSVPRPAGGPDFHIADFEVGDQDLEFAFSGAGALTFVETRQQVRRSEGSPGGVRIESDVSPEFVVTSKVEKNGKFRLTVPGEGDVPLGAVTRDGMFGCCVINVVTGGPDNSLLFFVKLPPAK